MKKILNQYLKLKLYYSYTIVVSIICSILLLLATNSMSALTTHITQNGLNNISTFIYKVLLLFIGFHFTNYCIFKIIKNNTQEYLNKSIYCQLNDTLTSSFTNVSNERGDLYTLIRNDANDSITFLSDTLIDIIYQLTRLFLVLIYIFTLNYQLSLIYIVAIFISIGIQKKFSSIISKKNDLAKKAEIKMNTTLQNILDNRLTIKMYNAEDFSKNLYKDKVADYTNAYLSVESKALPFRMIGIFLGLLPILSLCVLGIYFIKNNIITLETFLSIEYICNCVVYDQLHFSDFITESAKALISIHRISEYIQNAHKKTESIKNTTNNIILDNINFCYPNTNTFALYHLSLHISYGTKVAIIGKSGCGKSTLMKLISSNINANSGYIDIPKVTFVEQFPFLFSDTVKNNITCWKPVNENKYQHITSICKIKDFIKNDQLILKKNAANLSGGQKQKIALARALMNTEKVLLLDESFSNMDTKSAQDILHCILHEYTNYTIILSTHQLELLQQMDRIVMLEKGAIVFDGTYEEYEERYGQK